MYTITLTITKIIVNSSVDLARFIKLYPIDSRIVHQQVTILITIELVYYYFYLLVIYYLT